MGLIVHDHGEVTSMNREYVFKEQLSDPYTIIPDTPDIDPDIIVGDDEGEFIDQFVEKTKVKLIKF